MATAPSERIRLGAGFAALTACLLLGRTVPATEAADIPAPRVLYLRGSDTPALDDKLFGYLKAHLGDAFALDVVIQSTDTAKTPEQLAAAAKTEIEFRGAAAAVRLTPDGRTLMVSAPELAPEPWTVTVSGEPAGSSNWCESIAVLLMSDLSPLIPPPPSPASSEPPAISTGPEAEEEAPEVAPVPAPAPASAKASRGSVERRGPKSSAAVVRTETDAPSSIHAAPTPRKRSPKAPTSPWIGIAAGYTPAWQIADLGALHTAGFEIAAGFTPYFRLSIQGSAPEKATFVIDAAPAVLRRIPCRMLAHGALPLGSAAISLGIGVVWTPTYIRDLPRPPTDARTTQTQHMGGFAAQLTAEYWVTLAMGFRLAGGVDIFLNTLRLTLDNETVLTVNRIGGTLFVGIVGRLFIKGGSGR